LPTPKQSLYFQELLTQYLRRLQAYLVFNLGLLWCNRPQRLQTPKATGGKKRCAQSTAGRSQILLIYGSDSHCRDRTLFQFESRVGISLFEGGAQGEHKMARGLMPVKTYSAHYIADRRFAHAIGDFLKKEAQAVDGYLSELNNASPMKTPTAQSEP
jgi:hypothetical protein